MPSVERPDLDEFISALNGFLEKQTAPHDPSYLRFLEIFCRSVGSGEGHLLKKDSAGKLESVLVFGINSDFQSVYNKAASTAIEPSPLDEVFDKQNVIAIVELKEGPGVPPWFMKLMTAYDFKSLVAVPLLGHSQPVGILCAYYHDVCLFDQGTLDRLMGIGRMVGAATEKSVVAGRVEAHDAKEKVADELLAALTSKTFGKLEVYGLLRKMVAKALDPASMICGPLRLANGVLTMTVVDGENVPSSIISHRLALPPILYKKLMTGEWIKNPLNTIPGDWGEMAPFFKKKNPNILCEPMLWQGKLQSAVIAWRHGGEPFNDDDQILLNRLSSIASLAIN